MMGSNPLELQGELRQRLVEVLTLWTQPDEQRAYQSRAPDVDVSAELFNQWDDWYSPQAPQFRGAFSEGELDALQQFDSVLQEAGKSLPQTLPAIEALMETAEWKRIVAAAQIALLALSPRRPVKGRHP